MRFHQAEVPDVRFTRRGVIGSALASGVGLNLLGLLRARAEAAPLVRGPDAPLPPIRSCIAIFYYGGPSQLETFDPKPDAPAEIRGEFGTIATSAPGVRISEHLPMTARVMHKAALIRSMHHKNTLHDPASIHTFTGRLPPQGDFELFSAAPQQFPSWGGTVAYMLRDRDLAVAHAALPFVFHNVVETPCQGAGFLGSSFDPFRIEVDPGAKSYRSDLLASREGIDADRRGVRRALLETMESRTGPPGADRMKMHYEKAYRLLASEVVGRALDISREDPRLLDRYGSADGVWAQGSGTNSESGYGRNMRGRNLLLARRLVEAGVPFVNVYDFKQQGQNWDTHSRNFAQHKETLLPPMDRGFSALVEDLDARGLLESTLVVGLGEFGRTPRINKDAGRDHWPQCYSVILAGGGVRGGTVVGASDRFAAYPDTDPVTPADLAATIFWRFGLDPASEIRDTQNRPYKLADGQPITALF
ncbi:MAG: DUF1501 domain-containing protein [Paludisphaera borealis]|uniref:DUF1501 domain-containing protein n=1 Tax=Paludisphaera borealis TaxID=1387353 RepID=UPI00284B9B9A|nr:DUF1501 domain-containing protein [Paludisphaera borealis]MDR3621757.1 DUF1501 domain-containing protein [Paludisphaera borealis]